jgi:mRNA interferase MazF
MSKLNFGDIVLLKFPFTDGKSHKKRPALILNDFDDGDILVCRITSQIYKTTNDIFIDELKESGLKLPSVIRVHKIATLEKSLVEFTIGILENSIKLEVSKTFSKLLE